MNVEDIAYILDLFPDAEVVSKLDGTLEIRRLGKLRTRVRPDGSLYVDPPLPAREPWTTTSCRKCNNDPTAPHHTCHPGEERAERLSALGRALAARRTLWD